MHFLVVASDLVANAAGRRLAGLVRRREAERALFLSDMETAA